MSPNATAILPTNVGHLAVMDPTDLSLAGFLARYTGQTFVEYRRDMKLYLGWCMQNQLPPLTAKRAHLELYVRWLETRGWKSATVSRRFSTVATYYKVATMDDLIVKDPAVGVVRPKVRYEEQKRTVLNGVEYAALLDTARAAGHIEHALVSILGMMGLRIAEACSLNVEAMSIDKGYDVITFVGKGGDSYTEPFPIPELRAVRACVGDRTSGPLLTTRTGNRMDRSAAHRMLRRLGTAAGIKTEFSPHSLRRTFATTGLQQGVPLRDVQLAMRHKNPNTTTRYDMRSSNLDRHASHRIASHLSGMAS